LKLRHFIVAEAVNRDELRAYIPIVETLLEWAREECFNYRAFYLVNEELKQFVYLWDYSDRVHEDLRADSHCHGELKHAHPDYARMRLCNYKLKAGKTGDQYSDYKRTEQTLEVSLSALSQFVSSEKISPYCSDQVNEERIKRSLNRLCTCNYDKDRYLYNEDILNQTAIVAQQWGFYLKEKLSPHLLPLDP
jgi:hypothetical protein